MCEPISISIAMAAATAYTQQRQQEAAHEAQKQAHKANKLAANQSAMNEHRSLNERETQEAMKTAQEKNQSKLEATRALGQARTSAGEAGVGGQAVNSLLSDIHRQNANRTLAINQNYDSSMRQLSTDRHAMEINRQSRINSVAKPRYNSALAFTNSALAGGSAGLSTYGAANSI